jgi:hypothetical protein
MKILCKSAGKCETCLDEEEFNENASSILGDVLMLQVLL